MNRIAKFLLLLIAIAFSQRISSQVSISKGNPVCGSENGSVTVIVPFCVGPHTVYIDGQEGSQRNDLGDGNVSISIQLENFSCDYSESVELEATPNFTLKIEKEAIGGGCGTPPDLTIRGIKCKNDGTESVVGTKNCGTQQTCSYSFTAQDECGNQLEINGLTLNIPSVCSSDPNEITGNLGNGDERWITPQTQMVYLVQFENDSLLASAPAKKVSIKVPLNEFMNPNSIHFLDYNFANQNEIIPGAPPVYQGTIDRTEDLGVLVDVLAGWDIINNDLVFNLISKDPLTGLFPVDPFIGLLPVNDSIGSGEGGFNFTIGLEEALLQTGDSINAQAEIIFDENESIFTNIWSNKIDAVPPSSEVSLIEFDETTQSVSLEFSAQDDFNGSQVESLSLFVKVDNNEEFELMAESLIPDSGYSFTFDPSTYYEFYTIAKDIAGNIQESPQNIASATSPGICIGDFDQDGDVDSADLLTLLSEYQCDANFGECIADINLDGFVNASDLLLFLSNYGSNCGLN